MPAILAPKKCTGRQKTAKAWRCARRGHGPLIQIEGLVQICKAAIAGMARSYRLWAWCRFARLQSRAWPAHTDRGDGPLLRLLGWCCSVCAAVNDSILLFIVLQGLQSSLQEVVVTFLDQFKGFANICSDRTALAHNP